MTRNIRLISGLMISGLPVRGLPLLGLLLALALSLVAQSRPVYAQDAPIRDLDQVGRAVVELQATGEYRELDDEDTYYYAGGTGFLIDPSGLVVTNNHVAAGGETILAYVNGDSRPRYATVVALSECSDLALLRLSGGAYPYLDWRTDEVTRGEAVYAFGFATDELRREDGVVREVIVDRASNLVASFATIVHSAAIDSGDSGGPLVDGEGRVVGINYAQTTLGRRSFTIAASEAVTAIGRMQRNQVSESLGISGEVWEEGNRRGVWIGAVQPNSPAAAAGLRAGQVLLSLNGRSLARDDSMATYCEQLRSWDGAAPLSYEVYSPDTQSRRRGAFVPTTAQGVAAEVAFARQQVADLEFLLPVWWSDIAVTVSDEDDGWLLEAAPNLTLWEEAQGGADLYMELLDDTFPQQFDPVEILAGEEDDDYCTRWSVAEHTHMTVDATFRGAVRRGTGCFEADVVVYFLVLRTQPASSLVFAVYTAWAQEDELAFDVFRNSFRVRPVAEPIPTEPTPTEPTPTQRGPSAVTIEPTARVVVAALNVRSGPGTEFPRVAELNQGAEVGVIGRDVACSWLKIELANDDVGWDVGWISANPDYVALAVACNEIPVTE